MAAIALDRARVVKGFLTAPLAAPVLFVVCATVSSLVLGLGAGQWEVIPGSVMAAWFYFVLSLPISYGVTTLFGIPVFLLFRRLHRSSVLYWVTSAGVLGLTAGLVLAMVLKQVEFPWLVGLAAFGAA